MTRNELYNRITPCGNFASYGDTVYLLESLVFTDEQIRLALKERITQSGKLSQQDWMLLFRSVTFTPGSPVNTATAEEWLTGKCNLTRSELKLFLEHVSFRDGSQPTYILSQGGDFIIAE